jgi:hypothetical protein
MATSEEIERIQGLENAPFIGALSFGEFENQKAASMNFATIPAVLWQ